MTLKLGSHKAPINYDIWRYLEIISRRYLTIISRISVRFTLNRLRSNLWSFFDIISDSVKRSALFLQLAVMFKMKKKNESKRNHRVPGFFTNEKKKDHSTIYQAMKLADRKSFLLRFNSSSIQCSSKFQHYYGYLQGTSI